MKQWLYVSVLVSATCFAVGCQTQREEVTLIEPTYSFLRAEPAPLEPIRTRAATRLERNLLRSDDSVIE